MTKDDILRMAREAGATKAYANNPDSECNLVGDGFLGCFAALVAKAVFTECVRVCEEIEPDDRQEGAWIAGWSDGTDDCVAAIRARWQV